MEDIFMKRIRILFIAVCLLAVHLPALATSYYVVANPNSTWVHLRQEPTTNSVSLGRYDNGTPVRVQREARDGWYLVEVGTQQGFMLQSMLAPADETGRCAIVGRTSEGENIVRYLAENGQEIFFTTLETNPKVKMEDVNFDGQSDIVAFTVLGSSNFFCEFFVYDGAMYHQAEHPHIAQGLCNYDLFPEKGIVQSQTIDGLAGALHDTCLFTWDGLDLKLIRRATGQQRTELENREGAHALVTYTDEVEWKVRDYANDPFEGSLLWEETLRLGEGDEQKALKREQKALWQGL